MAKHFVLVAGNIASGKTSLTEQLGKRLGWSTAYESVADNPYLADFYGDMEKWSFHLNVFFLGHRAEQHRLLAQMKNSAIIDRSIYEDAEIFARASERLGNLSGRDFETYLSVFKLVVQNLPVPDLLIFLRAPVPILQERIRSRGRNMEEGIPVDYLQLLETLYDDWMNHFDLCPVLTIPADNLDFVNKKKHLDIVVERIHDKLSGKEELTFPED